MYHSYFLYTSTWIAKKVIRLQTEGEGGERVDPCPRGGCAVVRTAVAEHKLRLQSMPAEGVLPLPSETSFAYTYIRVHFKELIIANISLIRYLRGFGLWITSIMLMFTPIHKLKRYFFMEVKQYSEKFKNINRNNGHVTFLR